MQVKTYGINGLSEWYGKLSVGTISVNVAFTGGTASPSGALPAYMVTKDPITQFVIENSKEYKNGFIHLERTQEIPGVHPRMASATKGTSAGNGKTEPINKIYPEVTKTQDAKEILLNEYGINVDNIRSKAAVHEVAASMHIDFPNLQ